MRRMGPVTALRAKGMRRGRVKRSVGGAPLSDEFAHAIGADSNARGAANAVVRVKELIGEVWDDSLLR